MKNFTLLLGALLASFNLLAQDPVVFDDDFGTGVSFVAFGGSLNDISVVTTEANSGTSSLQVVVPATDYTGGALAVNPGRDVSSFDNLTFWAKASQSATLNVAGVGNNGVDPPTNQTEVTALALTTDWQQFTITPTDPSLLSANTGLFHFAEGSDEGAYTIWIDDITYGNDAPPPPAVDPVVFDDDFGTGVSFVAFGGSLNDISVVTTEANSGTSSLQVVVPATDYTGGALAVNPGRDVSSFDNLTFWAKASKAATLNVAGVGNNGVDPPTNQTEVTALALTTDWQQFTITPTDPSLLSANTGLFHFAEGSDEGAYTIWIDDITYGNDAPPPPAVDPVVFDDDFGTGVSFVAFGGSLNDISVVTTEANSGTSSLQVVVPATDYTGGALAVNPGRDVSSFDNLTFWAKASKAATLNVAGVGNNGVDPPTNQTEVTALALTTDWQQFTITPTDPSLLSANTGLFHFAEGSDEGAYTIWIDDITYGVTGGGGGGPMTGIAVETFDAAPSISDWTVAGDPNTETTITWSAAGGNPDGAIVLQGTNTDGVGGRGFVFEVIKSGLDFTDVTDVQLQFDMKTDGPLVGTAVHLRTNLPGTGFQETFDIQNQGLNETTFTPYSFDFSSVSGGASDNFTFGLTFAVGAGLDFGGSIIIDNVRLLDASTGGGGGPMEAVTIDFEAGGSGADYTWTPFENPDATGFSIVSNPFSTGINTSATVGQYIAADLGQDFAGLESAKGDIGPFSFDETNSSVKIMVYKTVISNVGLRFVDAGGSSSQQLLVPNTLTNEWEELTFYFDPNQNDNTNKLFNQIIIFPDFAPRDQDNTILIDNISFNAPPPPPPAFPVDFEDAGGPYVFGDFGGGVSSIVDNPGPEGINTSAKVAKMEKFADQPFGATTLTLDGNIDYSEGQIFKMKVWASREVPVTFKLEAGGDITRIVNHTGSSTWEELTFDFSSEVGLGATGAISIFFDNGVVGDALNSPNDWTFFYDDIVQEMNGGGGGGPVEGPNLIVNGGFEDNSGDGLPWLFIDNNGTVAITDTETNSGTYAVSLVADPLGGPAASAPVLKQEQFGAGMVSPGDQVRVTFNIKAVVTQPGAVVNVALFSEQTAGAVRHDIVLPALTGDWQTITADITTAGTLDPSRGLSIEFQAACGPVAGCNIEMYIDDVSVGSLEEAGGGGPMAALPVDFEDAGAPYTFGDFGGGTSSVVDNPGAAGINTSAKVAKMEKFAGETFGGTTLTLDDNIDYSAGQIIKMKVWASREVPVTFKLEAGGDITRIVNHTGSSTWEELVFDFSSEVGLGATGAVSIFFDNGVNGDALGTPNDWTFFYDDIVQEMGGTGPTAATFPRDFEVGGVGSEADFANFAGGASIVIDNPDATGINMSAKVVQMQKFADQVFGGTSVGLDGSIDYTQGQVFKMKVWASRAVPVTFKLNQDALPEGGTTERVVSHTGSSTWEELVFDFSSESGIQTTSAVVVIFDNGQQGGAVVGEPSLDWTFYYDDISQDMNAIDLTAQVITFEALADKTLGDAAFTLAATSDSGLDVTFSSTSDKVDIVGAEVTLIAAGRVTIDADQAGNDEFDVAPTVSQSFCINPIAATISEASATDTSVTLESSSAAGNQWFFNGIAIDGAIETTYVATEDGAYTVQVSIDDCASAISAAFDVQIGDPTEQTITFDALADKTLGDDAFTLVATASSDLLVTFSSTSDKISIDGDVVTLVSAGRVSIDADQAGNDEFAPATTVTQDFCINPMQPVITVSNDNSTSVTLSSSSDTGNQWFLNGEAIEGATAATLNATSEGVYSVQVSVDDCVSAFSEDLALIVTSTGLANITEFTVYPNPASDYIEVSGFSGDVSDIQLFDLSGRLQQNTFKLEGGVVKSSISELPNGVYLLMINSAEVTKQIRIIKN